MYRHRVAVEAGPWYRVDSASGSSTPVSVLQPDGVTTVGNAFGGTGSTVHASTHRGNAEFLSATQVLYLKRLTYKGALSGDTPITSTGADLTIPSGPTSPSDVAAILAGLPTTYGPSAMTVQARKLLTQIRPMAQPDPFTVTGDVPTVTAGTSATLTGRQVAIQGGEVTEVGSRGTWDNSTGALTTIGGYSGLDFIHTGSAVEVEVKSNVTGALPFWVFVNGQPIASSYDTSTIGAASVNATYYLKLTFGAAATRRIEVFVLNIAAWYRVRGNLGDIFAPAPRRPVAAWVGDSFWAGSNGSNYFDLAPFLVSRRLGFECYISRTSFGGTGYTTAGSFSVYGSAARVADAAKSSPDLLVFQGSVNDDVNAASVQAAASSAFAAYAAGCPQALQVVLGPQPSQATDTITATRAANAAAVRAAATSSPRVIGFFDEVGTAASGAAPSAWASGTSYNHGDLVTRVGSVWKATPGAGNTVSGSGETPGTSRRWQLVTWGYYGTGKVGTTASDGTRDTLVYSDGVHPTSLAQLTVFAPFTEKAIRDALAYYAANAAALIG
jgi:hypothetical protein